LNRIFSFQPWISIRQQRGRMGGQEKVIRVHFALVTVVDRSNGRFTVCLPAGTQQRLSD
jgi:hypothetical protein